jgi:hypothetical protein
LSGFAAYIGQFTRHGNKAWNRDGLGAPRRIDAGCLRKPRGINTQ